LNKISDIFIDEENSAHFVIDYFGNGNLKDLILSKKLDKNSLILYLKQLCEGLAFLHSNEIIHKDIKPQNILLNNENNLIFNDILLSKILEDETSFDVNGTLEYLAPEVFESKVNTKSSDIWSLGCIFYEMITLKIRDDNFSYSKNVNSNFYKKLSEEFIQINSSYIPLVDLVVSMLDLIPEKRISLNDIITILSKFN